jgi:hypothetical protein
MRDCHPKKKLFGHNDSKGDSLSLKHVFRICFGLCRGIFASTSEVPRKLASQDGKVLVTTRTQVVLAEMYKVQGGRACGMVCFHSDEAKIEAGDGRGDAGDFGDADS